MGDSIRQVEAIVANASIDELARALVVPDHQGVAPRADFDELFCPTCQALPGEWLRHGPAARGQGWLLACGMCCISMTIWQLRDRVLADPDAIGRLLRDGLVGVG